ncbi:hypothetical protein ABN057_18005 [Providencia alcalifaciens]|uniref:hypothetical protein n=1 Tax=Providencia TaxID=586 RepID=UPI0019D2ECFB|nr:hypothetical protein [Providencia rettgeri]MBN6364413.1 hypothetical protein [Providencia rettgeri]
MSTPIKQLISEIVASKNSINTIFANKNQCYVIHYSCESFYDAKDGKSTRITSIAIRNLGTAQTHHWALNRSAELLRLDINSPNDLDSLEFHLLDNYFNFLSVYSSCTFIHWNMRDNNYGFQALQHRFSVLGGSPTILSDDRKIDLARITLSIYGRDYIGHADSNGRKGRMLALVEKNNIADQDAMPGEEEASAYVNGKFRELEMSTLRKVDILCNIAERVHDRTLKTNNKWYKPKSYHPYYLFSLIKEHPMYITLLVIAAILGSIEKLWGGISKFF